MARNKAERPPTNGPMNPKCSSCGGPRCATTPRDQRHDSDTYLWCPTCDGSTIDVPENFLDRDYRKHPEM